MLMTFWQKHSRRLPRWSRQKSKLARKTRQRARVVTWSVRLLACSLACPACARRACRLGVCHAAYSDSKTTSTVHHFKRILQPRWLFPHCLAVTYPEHKICTAASDLHRRLDRQHSDVQHWDGSARSFVHLSSSTSGFETRVGPQIVQDLRDHLTHDSHGGPYPRPSACIAI